MNTVGLFFCATECDTADDPWFPGVVEAGRIDTPPGLYRAADRGPYTDFAEAYRPS
jgi:hypothetical protein